ncbi:MAG: hypothetical protein IJN24_01415 [Bacteroidaceae bacterium]|nr:hypothetical protein [Bacteroidaceae bacterium]
MKKILLFAACLISMTDTTVAQEPVFEFEKEGEGLLSKVISKDKNNIEFYIEERNDENTVFTIYDDDFQEIKKTEAPAYYTNYLSGITIFQEREQSGTKVSVAYTDYIWDCYDNYYIEKFNSINDVRESIRLIGLVETTTVEKGDSIFFYFKNHTASSTPVDDAYYFKYDTYGTKYPMLYWLAVKESDRYRLHHVERYYEELPEYNGEWCTVDIDTTYSSYYNFPYFSIADYNHPIHYLYTDDYLSNDIFDNNPKTYEYAIKEYAIEEDIDTIYNDFHWRAPQRSIKTYYKTVVKNTHIYSDGEKFFTIQGVLDEVMLVNNKTYLVTYKSPKYTVYRYNPATTSAEAIHEYTSRSKVNMNDNIVNIELQQASNSDSELVLTSAAGKVYKRKHIAAGTKNVQIDMRNMPRGVYNISLLEKGKAIESSKVMKH